MSTSRSKAVVIGLGNPLMGDDGLGIAALERLRARWDVPSQVELVDGGTWGMNLLPLIEDADQVLLIDAITAGSEAGMQVVVPRARLPRYLATKISPHQVDLRDVLALAELRGTLPEETIAIGLEPAGIEFGNELSDEVRSRLDDLVDTVVRQLESWGHACTCRPAPAHA
ncbi:MAG TPA: HyaD/HybD family hydrogenase maturation endopeptidase [Gemmatimonadales bacterium]|nr:HyaD/HybD family hydrogenase maturation endopeptidase [Gemmatimonadales bacterium]